MGRRSSASCWGWRYADGDRSAADPGRVVAAGASVKGGITSPRSIEDAVPKTGTVTTDAAEDWEWKIVESSGGGEAAAQAAAEALMPEMPRVELGA